MLNFTFYFIRLALVHEMSFEILVKKFKCRENVTLTYMWGFYGISKTKFQNVKFVIHQFVGRNVNNGVFVRETNRRIPCEGLKLLLMRLDEVVDLALNVLLCDFLEDKKVNAGQNIIHLLPLFSEVDVKFLLFLSSSKNGGSEKTLSYVDCIRITYIWKIKGNEFRINAKGLTVFEKPNIKLQPL